jgi:hypothetical protein
MYVAKIIGTDIEVRSANMMTAYNMIRQLTDGKISMRYIKE